MDTSNQTGAYLVAFVIDQIRIARWMQSDMPEGISEYGQDAEFNWEQQLDTLNEMLSEESGYDVTILADECGWDFLAFHVHLDDPDADDGLRTLRLEVTPTFGISNVQVFEADGKTEIDDDAAWHAIDAVSEALDGVYAYESGDDSPYDE